MYLSIQFYFSSFFLTSKKPPPPQSSTYPTLLPWLKRYILLFKLEKIWYGLKVSWEKGFGGDEKVTRFGLHKWETSTWNNSMAPTSTITFNSSSCLPSVHVEVMTNFVLFFFLSEASRDYN